MTIFYLLPYLAFCVWLAYDNADRIADGRKIHHALNGALHLTAAGVIWWLNGLSDAVTLLLLIRIVFDTALNLFRGLSFDYVSKKPVSRIDRLEKAVFGSNKVLANIIYLIAVICLQILK